MSWFLAYLAYHITASTEHHDSGHGDSREENKIWGFVWEGWDLEKGIWGRQRRETGEWAEENRENDYENSASIPSISLVVLAGWMDGPGPLCTIKNFLHFEKTGPEPSLATKTLRQCRHCRLHSAMLSRGQELEKGRSRSAGPIVLAFSCFMDQTLMCFI
jgi:hypothetical protein